MKPSPSLAAFYLEKTEDARSRASAQTEAPLRKLYNKVADLWMAKLQDCLSQ